jgi:hypothetical protein
MGAVVVVAASIAAVRVRRQARRLPLLTALLGVVCAGGFFDDSIGGWQWYFWPLCL